MRSAQFDDPGGQPPSAASVHEAYGQLGALDPGIRPLSRAMVVWGPAYPVFTPPGDNLSLHWALEDASPGDVLVVDASGTEFGFWGEVMHRAAAARGLGGIVIDGGVRDSQVLAASPVPVFSRLVSLRGTTKRPDLGGTAGAPVRLGGVCVRRGDLVVGDADGIVVVAAADADRVVAAARAREAQELEIFSRIARGESTRSIYSLPELVDDAWQDFSGMRRAIYLDGLGHGDNPIPAAAMVGGLFASGNVTGRQRHSETVPESIVDEITTLFDNVAALIETSGASLDSIVRFDFVVSDLAVRQFLNAEWLRRFTEKPHRPARRVEIVARPLNGPRIQCSFIAFVEERRPDARRPGDCGSA